MTNVTIDIGNTIISFCMFEKNKLLKHKKIPKDKLDIKVLKFIKSRFFKNQKVKLLISSVVPSSEKIITSFLKDNLINSYSLKDLLKKIDIKTNIKSFKRGMASCYGEGLIENQLACKADFNLILPDEIKKYNLKTKKET